MATNAIEMATERTLAEEASANGHGVERASNEEFALLPLVDRIARGIASGLVMAMKELENHIASETRKVGETVGRRLDNLQTALKEADARQQADLSSLRAETAAVAASLKAADERHEAELAAVRAEAATVSSSLSERIDTLDKEVTVHQEDIGAIKTTLGSFSATVEGLVQRLDRQADALRSMCAAYAQRETELEQLVSGLARLRAYPAPAPTDRL